MALADFRRDQGILLCTVKTDGHIGTLCLHQITLIHDLLGHRIFLHLRLREAFIWVNAFGLTRLFDLDPGHRPLVSSLGISRAQTGDLSAAEHLVDLGLFELASSLCVPVKVVESIHIDNFAVA